MKSICEKLNARLVSDEDVTDLQSHIDECEICQSAQRTIAQLHQLAPARDPDASDRSPFAAEPSPGFAARISAGAQRRITTRRRQRHVVFAGGGLAAAAAIALFVTHNTTTAPIALQTLATPNPTEVRQPDPALTDAIQDDLRSLVRWQLASRRYQRGHLPSANWKRIERPVAAYKHLLVSSK
jgi:hypothetical protein